MLAAIGIGKYPLSLGDIASAVGGAIIGGHHQTRPA